MSCRAAIHLLGFGIQIGWRTKIDIISRHGGVTIHDCWTSYLTYEHCDHGLCGSHLLRELEFVRETNGYAWARNMKPLLQQTCKQVSDSNAKRLTDRELANLQKRYRNILTQVRGSYPLYGARPSGKRGHLAKPDAHNLWEHLQRYESAVLLFARDPYVSFTNNRAERDLRMAKVKQKVSNNSQNNNGRTPGYPKRSHTDPMSFT